MNMKYPIGILLMQKQKHLDRINELTKEDHEMYSSVLFTEEEVKQHEESIFQLEKAIEILLKH